MPTPVTIVRTADVPVSTRMGGEIRPLLTPASAGTRAGFVAELVLAAGERTSEHYHPWSDEHVLLLEGRLLVEIDGQCQELSAGDAVLIRRGARHTMTHAGSVRARAALFIAPLAPDPADGHVDTEPAVDPTASPPTVGSPTSP
jgi:putative monooxygenase